MRSSIITLGKLLLILGKGSKCINEYIIHKYSHRTLTYRNNKKMLINTF